MSKYAKLKTDSEGLTAGNLDSAGLVYITDKDGNKTEFAREVDNEGNTQIVESSSIVKLQFTDSEAPKAIFFSDKKTLKTSNFSPE